MYTIRIGKSERPLSEANESWIVQNVQQRKADHLPVCVQVLLKNECIDLILSTPACSSGGGGGGRGPNEREQRIFDLWNERHMNQNDWAVGNLIAFIKQLSRII